MTTPQLPGSNLHIPHKTKRKKIRIKKTVPLHVIASNMAQDVIGAIMVGISSKANTGLEQGDELDDVVEQALGKSGMAEIQEKMARIRLQVKIGVDLSGSQYDRDNGRTIVPSLTMLRMFQMALSEVSTKLPPNVFKFSSWLWAAYIAGRHTVCFDDLMLGSYIPPELTPYILNVAPGIREAKPVEGEPLDQYLELISRNKPFYSGKGTMLEPQIKGWMNWEQKYGDPGAHRLDILITDGMTYDTKEAGALQVQRMGGGKYIGVMYQVGRYETSVPEGFTTYRVEPHLLDAYVRETLMGFIQKVI